MQAKSSQIYGIMVHPRSVIMAKHQESPEKHISQALSRFYRIDEQFFVSPSEVQVRELITETCNYQDLSRMSQVYGIT